MADNHEQRPLLADAASIYTYAPLTNDGDEAAITAKDQPSRSVDDDVLPETSALGRTLSWTSSYMLVMSRVIGSGIFATPGTILQAAGSPGLSLLLWAVGALVAAAGLAVALEYGCMLPRSGGQKVYLEFTYRHPRFLASTLVAVNAVLLGFTASNCVIFSRYVLFAAGRDDAGDGARKALAAGLLSAVTAVHAVAPRLGVRLQDALGWAKMGIVGFMVLCGGYAVALRPAYTGPDAGTGPGGAGADALLSWERLWHGSNWSWGVACTALFKVFYSYAGLDNVSNVLNEVRDPVRTLRSVTLTALVTSCALYMLVNVAYFLVVPLDDIRGSGELVAALFFERIFGQDVGRKVLPLAVALSAVGNVLVVAFAMVRTRAFSRSPSPALTRTLTPTRLADCFAKRRASSKRLPGRASFPSPTFCRPPSPSTRLLAACWSTTYRLCSSSSCPPRVKSTPSFSRWKGTRGRSLAWPPAWGCCGCDTSDRI